MRISGFPYEIRKIGRNILALNSDKAVVVDFGTHKSIWDALIKLDPTISDTHRLLSGLIEIKEVNKMPIVIKSTKTGKIVLSQSLELPIQKYEEVKALADDLGYSISTHVGDYHSQNHVHLYKGTDVIYFRIRGHLMSSKDNIMLYSEKKDFGAVFIMSPEIGIQQVTELPIYLDNKLRWSIGEIEVVQDADPGSSSTLHKHRNQYHVETVSQYRKDSSGVVLVSKSIVHDHETAILDRYKDNRYPGGSGKASYEGKFIYTSYSMSSGTYSFWVNLSGLGWIETTAAWLMKFSTGDIHEEFQLVIHMNPDILKKC
ncbi:hypothetical protein D3C78_18990 [compost metagenome]